VARWTSATRSFALLARAQAFAELSGGAFDISYAAVGRLYDYRRGVAPDEARVAAARACVGWRGIVLDPADAHACALPARACASTSAVSPRATRWTAPRRACARSASATPM
jgi:thiamine biosynthesis lipoprotein ApbE